MADGKSEKAPSAVTENKEEPPTEQAPPAEGANRSMVARSTAPSNQGARGKGKGGAPCFGDCVVTPLKMPTLGLDDIKSPSFIKMLGGEFLGTLLLVFFGIGSVVTAHQSPPLVKVKSPANLDKDYYSFESGPNPDKLHVSFAFGIAVASIAQAIGHISGCHLNPAVSFGLWAAGQCGLLKTLCYIPAQCFGALAGAGLLRMMTMHLIQLRPNHEYLKLNATFDDRYIYWGLGASTLADGVDIPTGILIECLLTFILVLTVCGCCDDLRTDIKGSAPLAIGFAVFICHVTGIGFTGASVNPARSFGPAIVAFNVKNVWKHHAVYWVGPLLGGFEAGVTYATFFRAKGDPKPASDERSVVP